MCHIPGRQHFGNRIYEVTTDTIPIWGTGNVITTVVPWCRTGKCLNSAFCGIVLFQYTKAQLDCTLLSSNYFVLHSTKRKKKAALRVGARRQCLVAKDLHLYSCIGNRADYVWPVRSDGYARVLSTTCVSTNATLDGQLTLVRILLRPSISPFHLT